MSKQKKSLSVSESDKQRPYIKSPSLSKRSRQSEDIEDDYGEDYEADYERTVIRLRTPSTMMTKGQILNQFSSTDVREFNGEFSFKENEDADLSDVPFKLTKYQAMNLRYTRKLLKYYRSLLHARAKLITKLHLSFFLEGVRRYQIDSEDGIYRIKPKKRAKLLHRVPHFTHWVTMTQVMVYLCSISTFGFANFGFGVTETTEKVKMPNVQSQRRTHYEDKNPLIGISQLAMVQLGARHTPCMRIEEVLLKEKAWRVAEELESACCILHSREGCYQSQKADCNDSNSMFWYTWSVPPHGPRYATKGSVCGQDPRYCDDPDPEADPREAWLRDITRWPICKKPRTTNSTVTTLQHMRCRRQAFPCCLGIRGRCIVTSWEHCDLLKGTIHEEATLCAQVMCGGDTCGMFQFTFQDNPFQIYRLMTTLMIPEGLVTLAFTVWFQLYVMQDLERVFGLKTLAVLYVGCGMVANLAGSVMTPMRVKSGAGASQCAVLAFLQGILFWHRRNNIKPFQVYLPMIILCTLIIVFGFLPWVDFWGNLWGFILGYIFVAFRLPASMALLNKTGKLVPFYKAMQFLSFLLVVVITTLFALSFWKFPFGENKIFNAFDCLPFTSTFCNPVDPELGKTSVANTTALGIHGAGIMF